MSCWCLRMFSCFRALCSEMTLSHRRFQLSGPLCRAGCCQIPHQEADEYCEVPQKGSPAHVAKLIERQVVNVSVNDSCPSGEQFALVTNL